MRRTQGRPKRRLADTLSGLVFYLVMGVLVLTVFMVSGDKAPRIVMGWSAFTVLTHSMDRVYPQGSILFVKQVDPDIPKQGTASTQISGSR